MNTEIKNAPDATAVQLGSTLETRASILTQGYGNCTCETYGTGRYR